MTLTQEVDFLLDTICDLDFIDHIEYSFIDKIEPGDSYEVIIVMKYGALGNKVAIKEILYNVTSPLCKVFNSIDSSVDISFIFPEIGDYKRYMINYIDSITSLSTVELKGVSYPPNVIITKGYTPFTVNKKYKDLYEHLRRIKNGFSLDNLTSYSNELFYRSGNTLAGIIFNFDISECIIKGAYYPIYFIFKEDTQDWIISDIVERAFKIFTDICEMHCLKGWHKININSGALVLEEIVEGTSKLEQLKKCVN